MSTTQRVPVAEVSREMPASPFSSRLSVGVFTLAVFFSALLLFVLEPMFAKRLLPVFGGSPSVWITCMVFFQTVLLLGYVYSHVITARFTRTRIVLHFAALVASCIALPVALRGHVDPNAVAYHPGSLLLVTAAASIGLPFFFLSTTAPLLQRWFSHTDHPDASDPYFLYAASNAGSLLGLLLYPVVFEPKFALTRQANLWSAAYLVFVPLIGACAVLCLRGTKVQQAIAEPQHSPRPTRREELLWTALAFVPASLLYGVTSQLSTDFPPVPLLWVIPLAIYLVTFIIGFSGRFTGLGSLSNRLPTILLVAAMLFIMGNIPSILGLTGFLKLACFGLVALAMHGELARRRPAAQHLTRFYLLVSFGGVVAGVLNAMLAPLVFSDYWEYPITLVLAAALLPAFPGIVRKPVPPRVLRIGIALFALFIIVARMPGLQLPLAVRLGMFVACVFFCMRAPTRWTAVALVLVLSFSSVLKIAGRQTIYQARSFYGVYKVLASGKFHLLIHGTTMHGAQKVGEISLATAPTYYSAVGTVANAASQKHPMKLGVVGLGTGTTSCYMTPSESITFFEIDPLVERIARDSRYFTYMSQCPGTKKVVLGDARLTLSSVPPASFDVMVVDAFSSDAIPMHLLTREAFEIYRRTLTPSGVLLIHISNRYIDLQPVALGSADFPGYSTLVFYDEPTASQIKEGHFFSKWIALAPAARAQELQDQGWRPAEGKTVSWTDERSSLFTVVSWRKILDFSSLLSGLKKKPSGFEVH